jgi:crotonobetaine/carnitine-CoA ligase
VPALLAQRAAESPDETFCQITDSVFSYASMERRAEEVAAGFSRLGVSRGDRVAIITPNRRELIEMFFGLAKLGAIQVPLNAFLKGEFLRHQLAHSSASVLVCDAAGLAAAKPLLHQLPDLRLIVALDGEADPDVGLAQSAYADATAGAQTFLSPQIAPGDTMSIMYTSGTTGLPKGCVLSHGYYVRCARRFGEGLQPAGHDVFYSPLPLFHAGAQLLVLMQALAYGLRVVIDSSFSARACIARAREAEATILIALGAVGTALLAVPESPDDRNHRLHTMLIVPMPEALQHRLHARFGFDVYTECFGQTECIPVTISPRTSANRDRGGCGHPASDLEVALLDDDNRAVPDGEVGEICLRPRQRVAMFDGYWRDPEGTLKAFSGLWYHTGDFARRRPSGQLSFVDRKTDAMRRRGENVSSVEVEMAIGAPPAIAAVAVHAVPSPSTEDDIKACIVMQPGATIEPASLFRYLSEHLPYFAMPRYVQVLDALPTNAVGRVMKHVLKQRSETGEVWDFEAMGLRIERQERRRAAPTT